MIKKQLKKQIYKKRYECMWILILGIYMIYYLPMPSELHDFCVAPYVLSYNLGFISRGFVGSVLSLIFPYITRNEIWAVIGLNQIIMVFTIVVFLYLIRKSTSPKEKDGIIYLILLFLVNPASVSFLFYWGNYGRFDLFMIIGAVLCCILIIKETCVWLIPIICMLIMMIHQGFIFDYFPCVLLVLFYYYLLNKKNSRRVLFGVTLFLGSLCFLYFQFWGKIQTMSIEDTLNALSNRTNLGIDMLRSMVTLEYYTDVLDFIPMYILPAIKMNILKILMVIILLLPLEFIFYFLWKKFILESKKRWYCIFPLFIILATVPKFMITCDYGRDIASIFISQFLVIFTFYSMESSAMKSSAMKSAISALQCELKRHPFFAVSILLELAVLGKFEAANILDITNKVYLVLEHVIK